MSVQSWSGTKSKTRLFFFKPQHSILKKTKNEPCAAADKMFYSKHLTIKPKSIQSILIGFRIPYSQTQSRLMDTSKQRITLVPLSMCLIWRNGLVWQRCLKSPSAKIGAYKLSLTQLAMKNQFVGIEYHTRKICPKTFLLLLLNWSINQSVAPNNKGKFKCLKNLTVKIYSHSYIFHFLIVYL